MKGTSRQSGRPPRRAGLFDGTEIRYGRAELAVILVLIAIAVIAMTAAIGSDVSDALQEVAAKLG